MARLTASRRRLFFEWTLGLETQFIGPYKLREQIGEGGMGVVFVAEQEQPIRRKVALKIIKPGMDTRQVLARFEAERQALAMMDHPNIAKVFDAGTTDSGKGDRSNPVRHDDCTEERSLGCGRERAPVGVDRRQARRAGGRRDYTFAQREGRHERMPMQSLGVVRF